MSNADAGKYDKNMRVQHATLDGMDWYTVDTPGFQLDGLYWRKPGEPFRRLPDLPDLPDGVKAHATDTSGAMLRFKTNASEIRIHAKIGTNHRIFHMALTGSMGFDLYLGSGTAKHFYGASRFLFEENEYNSVMFGPGEPQKMREFTLHFPLYANPEYLRIGLTEGAVIEPPSPWKDPRPIVVYGTSIQQGASATRPGMSYSNLMSRMMDRPFINLAFSGSALGEPIMAQMVAEIENPAIFILDYDANAHVDGLEKTLRNFIDTLREKHPETPILQISRLPFGRDFKDVPEYTDDRYLYSKVHLDEVQRRRAAGDNNIHFVDGATLYGADPSDCMSDGCHSTDLGFYNIAQRLVPIIERILTLC